MRQLATVQKIQSIEPIEGADAVEKARILGWNVVVKKGEHKPGDLVVYCEIDSLLPELPYYEFLRPNYKAAIMHGGEVLLRAGFRIKTRKIRGQVSQGICFPLDVMSPPVLALAEEGLDVTSDLGIVKYEIPEDLGGRHVQGQSRSTFPTHLLPKTDETRVQVLGSLVAQNAGRLFNRTEKLDGSSFTAIVQGDTFMVCSRNLLLDLADETHMFVALAKKIGLEAKMRATQTTLGDFALQGEVVGPAIQQNKYKLAERELRVFDLYLLNTRTYATPDVCRMYVADMGLKHVPNLGDFTLPPSTDTLVFISEGKSALNVMVEREGIVVRPVSEPILDAKGNRISFKAISPKFLLKNEE